MKILVPKSPANNKQKSPSRLLEGHANYEGNLCQGCRKVPQIMNEIFI
jgi:hypothetical protein